MDIADMTSAVFARHVSTAFRVQMAPNQIIEMTLTAAIDKPSAPDMESFTLEFLAPPDAPVRQGMYRIAHDELGEFDFFIVPTGRDARGVRYEAVFVRRRTPAK
jgi:hypothetical protein